MIRHATDIYRKLEGNPQPIKVLVKVKMSELLSLVEVLEYDGYRMASDDNPYDFMKRVAELRDENSYIYLALRRPRLIRYTYSSSEYEYPPEDIAVHDATVDMLTVTEIV